MRFANQTVDAVDKMSVSTAGILLVCAVFLSSGNTVLSLTGRHDAAPLTSPDQLTPATTDDSSAFLIRRNVLEIKVAESMTVRQLLELYRLNKPDQVRQVFQQLPRGATPETMVRAGTRLKIAQTPIATDVPGTTPPQERP